MSRRLEALTRVRRVRARQATMARGRAEVQAAREAALLARVEALLAERGVQPGPVTAAALKAGAASDAMLARLAADVAQRLGDGADARLRLGVALGRARAALDAAVARRAAADEAAMIEAKAQGMDG